MWKRQDVDFIQSQDVPWSVVPSGELGAGERQRILSREPESGAATVLLQLRNEFHGVLVNGADIYVLEGNGRINGAQFAANHYVYVPAGARLDIEPGPLRTTFYVGHFGQALFESGDGEGAGADETGVMHVDVEALPWAAPEWNGDTPLEPGVFVKWLRRGPHGEVFVTSMLPGWASKVEERHPIYEESFRLYGDLLQGRRGRMGPGAYSYRSPEIWHCPMGTQGGTMSLIRSSAPITSDYREPEVGSWADLFDAAYRGLASPAVEAPA